jgi:LysR family glycine cleavage system transcriptional activator
MDLIPGTRALRTLVAAGKHLNFTRAAEEVNLTPAAVSHQIKEFEAQLGFELFQRNNRRVRMTEAGARFIEAVAESIDAMSRAAAAGRKIGRGAAMIRLTTESTFASRWMMPRLLSFRQAHPDLDLRFDVTDELRNFDLDDVDVGVRFGAGQYPGLKSDRLFDNVAVPVCSPALLESGKPLGQPRDLFNHALCHVVDTMQGATWPTWGVWMAAAGVDDFDERRCITFIDSVHTIQAALDGAAVALADLCMVADDLAAGRLVRPFDLGIRMEPQFAFYLVYPERSAADPQVQTFRHWLLIEARKTDAMFTVPIGPQPAAPPHV